MGATHKRDLRSGHSIWQRRPLSGLPERRLVQDTRCDVLIVGAGISGALAAEQQTDAGLSIVVIDRRGAVRGSTLASTSLLQYEIDTPLSKLAKRIGVARADEVSDLKAEAKALQKQNDALAKRLAAIEKRQKVFETDTTATQRI